jgi:error-prone DNA polymerase
METLAAIGAFAPLGATRRAALWSAAVPDWGPLFGASDASPACVTTTEDTAASPLQDTAASPLQEMTERERLVADYGGTGVTLGRHPMALARAELARRGVLRAIDLARVTNGARVRVAGSVIVRQRPGTAKGFVFLSLEDESGIANVIVTPALFARFRPTLVSEPFLLLEGILQLQDGVTSVRAARVEALPRLSHVVPSHDFG